MTDAQVVPVLVERGPGHAPERAAQVVHRDVERTRDLTQLKALVPAGAENHFRVVHDVR